MVNKERYALKRKEYNSDKTFIQISKDIHKKIKEYCKNNNIKVKDFVEKLLIENI